MQPPNRTKDRRPATKARTLVHANGALLAEQEVMEYQQTNYEVLRFVHQDASGTGVQQTLANGTLALPNGRTAEYDAMGRNVADPGPYVMLNTELPNENGSGIDLFGNGEGYRPGRVTYTHHGMVVPESFARQFVESGQIGGAFGLLEMAVRMSVRYEVDDHWGNTVYSGSNWGDAARLARRTETLTVYRTFNDSSWSVIASLIPVGQQQAPQIQGQEDDPVERFVKRAARKLLDDDTNNYTRVLKKAGLYDAVSDKLNGTNFVSVNDRGSESARDFFDVANPGETLSAFFRRWFGNPSNEVLENVAIANNKAIATLNGARTFAFLEGAASSRASEVRVGFFLHELVHHATGRDDDNLAGALLAARSDGDTRSSSQRLDQFFNNGCPEELVRQSLRNNQ